MRRILTIAATLTLAAAVPGAAQDAINPEGLADVLAGRPYSPYADRAFPTRVFFGDTHVHTGLSADAGGSGTTLLPRDSYRFARGEQVMSNTGQPVKLRQPFDFFMITDHSDAMGAITDIIGGAPNVMADPDGKQLHEDFNAGGEVAASAMQRMVGQFAQGTISPALNYQPGNPAYKRVWDDIVAAAEEFNDPGVFTTFIAFEWTALEAGSGVFARQHGGRLGLGKVKVAHVPGLEVGERLLLRSPVADRHAPLVDLRCEDPRRAATRRSAGRDPGTRLVITDLVQAGRLRLPMIRPGNVLREPLPPFLGLGAGLFMLFGLAPALPAYAIGPTRRLPEHRARHPAPVTG